MNDALTEAIKEAYAVAPSTVAIIETLEIRQEDVQLPIFLAKHHIAIEAFDENGDLHTFNPAGFQLSLPPANEEGFRSLNVVMDNVDRRLTEFIKLAKSEPVPITIIYRPYVSTDLSTPHMLPPLVLFLKEVQVVGATVTGRATFMDIVNKAFPNERYTRARFPALG